MGVEDYVIGPGDVLAISIWKEDALSRVVKVLPDGTISFPLIGELTAGGKSLSALKQEVNDKLKRFVPDPILSVSVQEVNSMMIYVIGKVNSPGRFVLNGYVDVLQALATAGGFNTFAKESKVRIFRRGNGAEGGMVIIDFNYDEVTKGVNLKQNIWLKRGDVIVVP
jgi:polysaccharide export outer membrane protein